MIHVYPLNDLREHDTEESTLCDCGPRVDLSDDGEMIVVHNSYDGREFQECDYRAPDVEAR